jgi:hypothetical protein
MTRARLAFCSEGARGAIIMTHPYFTLPATPEIQRHARRIARTMVIGYSTIVVLLMAIIVARVTFATDTTFVTAGTSTPSTTSSK